MERKVVRELTDDMTVNYKKINQIVSAVLRDHEAEIDLSLTRPVDGFSF